MMKEKGTKRASQYSDRRHPLHTILGWKKKKATKVEENEP